MDSSSLAHCKWECQYHIVFIPKYRKNKLYGVVRDDVREIIRTLCKYKGVEIPLVRPVTAISDNGWIGPDHPKHATEAWGADMLDACAAYIADFMNAFRTVPLP